MQIVRKDITAPKLTIAKDRVELKIPNNCEIEEGRIVALANKAIEGAGEIVHTLRGKFRIDNMNKLTVSMQIGTNETRKHFRAFTEV